MAGFTPLPNAMPANAHMCSTHVIHVHPTSYCTADVLGILLHSCHRSASTSCTWPRYTPLHTAYVPCAMAEHLPRALVSLATTTPLNPMSHVAQEPLG